MRTDKYISTGVKCESVMTLRSAKQLDILLRMVSYELRVGYWKCNIKLLFKYISNQLLLWSTPLCTSENNRLFWMHWNADNFNNTYIIYNIIMFAFWR